MNGNEFWFKPNMDIESIVPFLLWVGAVVLGVFVVAFIINLVRAGQKRAMDLRRFHVMARRHELNSKEQNLLLSLAKVGGIKKLSKLLVNQEEFERLVKSIEKRGYMFKRKLQYDERLIRYIRSKLFDADMTHGEIRSSHDLRVGLKLFLRYVDYADTAVWGHLVDVDRVGLVVVIPDHKSLKIPLRPQTYLEVTAYIPNRDPVTFNTEVTKVIPGPRKMVVLDHSEFVVRKSGKSPSMKNLATLRPTYAA